MKFLDDIKKQPQETREIIFGLAVFVTVLLVGMAWFYSFQKNLYVLMNPEVDVEKALAAENAPMPSLFGYIGRSLAEIGGLVSGFLGQEEVMVDENSRIKIEGGGVYTLPLSEYK